MVNVTNDTIYETNAALDIFFFDEILRTKRRYSVSMADFAVVISQLDALDDWWYIIVKNGPESYRFTTYRLLNGQHIAGTADGETLQAAGCKSVLKTLGYRQIMSAAVLPDGTMKIMENGGWQKLEQVSGWK